MTAADTRQESAAHTHTHTHTRARGYSMSAHTHTQSYSYCLFSSHYSDRSMATVKEELNNSGILFFFFSNAPGCPSLLLDDSWFVSQTVTVRALIETIRYHEMSPEQWVESNWAHRLRYCYLTISITLYNAISFSFLFFLTMKEVFLYWNETFCPAS